MGARLLIGEDAWVIPWFRHPSGKRGGEEGEENMILADIESGNTDLADILFLVAVVLFVIGAVLAWTQAKAVWATLVSAGLASVSLGWLVL